MRISCANSVINLLYQGIRHFDSFFLGGLEPLELQMVAWVAAFHPIGTTDGEIRCLLAFLACPGLGGINANPTELTILVAVLISGQLIDRAVKREILASSPT